MSRQEHFVSLDFFLKRVIYASPIVKLFKYLLIYFYTIIVILIAGNDRLQISRFFIRDFSRKGWCTVRAGNFHLICPRKSIGLYS